MLEVMLLWLDYQVGLGDSAQRHAGVEACMRTWRHVSMRGSGESECRDTEVFRCSHLTSMICCSARVLSARVPCALPHGTYPLKHVCMILCLILNRQDYQVSLRHCLYTHSIGSAHHAKSTA